MLRQLRKRSRLLLHWRADLGQVNGINGEAAVFTRAGRKWAIAGNGRIYTPVDNQPALEWVNDEPYLLLEAGSSNLVLRSEDFGTTWSAAGTPTRTAAAHTKSGITLDLIGDDAAGALEYYQQTITFTGNSVKAISVHFKQDTSTSSVVRVRDTSAGANRLLTAITWSGTTPVITMTTGTYVRTDTLADGTYRAHFTTTSVTAANTNIIEVFPATDAALAVGSTGRIYVGGVQAQDQIVTSAYVPTAGSTATQANDSFYLPFNASPREMTVYCKFIERGTVNLSGGYLFQIGASGAATDPRLVVYAPAGAYQVYHANATTNAEVGLGVAPSIGQEVEIRATLSSTGVAQIHQSIAGGAETSSSATVAVSLASAWSDTRIVLNGFSTVTGFNAFRCVKVAAGTLTMAQMRAAF